MAENDPFADLPDAQGDTAVADDPFADLPKAPSRLARAVDTAVDIGDKAIRTGIEGLKQTGPLAPIVRGIDQQFGITKGMDARQQRNDQARGIEAGTYAEGDVRAGALGAMRKQDIARDKEKAKTAPAYKNRQEAVDDAANLIDEGQDEARVIERFGKIGIKPEEIRAELDRRAPMGPPQTFEPQQPESAITGTIAEPQRGRLARGIDTGMTALERGGKQARQMGEVIKTQLPGGSAEVAATRIAETNRTMPAYSDDVSAAIEKMAKSKTMGEAVAAAAESPGAFLAVLAESLVSSSPSLLAVPVGIVGGPGAAAATAGVTSFAMEFGSSVQDYLTEKGMNPRDPRDIYRALTDPALMAEARDFAVRRGVPVAAFDALSAGIAGKVLGPVVRKIEQGTLKGAKAVGAAGAATIAEAGMQGAAGAIGELGGQYVSGQEYDPFSALAEFGAEFISAPKEVATNILHAARAGKEAQVGGGIEGQPPPGGGLAPTIANLERIETDEGPAFRTPSGAIVSESQWNDAPPDRREMWMQPAEGEQAPTVPRETDQAAAIAADVQLHRNESVRLEAEAERLRAAGQITQAETLRIRALSLAELADKIEAANGVSEQSLTPGIKVEEISGAPAPLEPTERMQELERLADVTQDPAVKKDLLQRLKAERQAQEQARKNEATADAYERAALETEDEALAAELKKKATALRKPEKPSTRGIQVKEVAAEEVELKAAGEVERRKDTATRKKYDEMSPEELRKELLTSPVTAMPNRRAYDEAPKRAVQTSIDVDSLKWVNDNMGHPAGDEMLRKVGEAIKESGAEGFHLSGDEFVIQTDTPDQAAAAMRKIRKALASATVSHTLPDGSVITKKGIDLSHGSGRSVNEAESKLRQSKAERARRGVRPERGAEPKGVDRKAPGAREEARGAGVGPVGRVSEGAERGNGPAEINTTPLWLKRSGLTLDDAPAAAKVRTALAADQDAVMRAAARHPDDEAAFLQAIQDIIDASGDNVLGNDDKPLPMDQKIALRRAIREARNEATREKPSADAGGRRADDVAEAGAEVRRAEPSEGQPNDQETRPGRQETARDVQQDGQPGAAGADLATRSRREQPRAERDQTSGDLASRSRREEMSWQDVELGERGDVFVAGDFMLDPVRELEVGTGFGGELMLGHAANVAPGNRVVRYQIAGRDGKALGRVDLQLDPQGNVVALHDISVQNRGQGVGRQVVGSLLANFDTLQILDIVPTARSFWEKLGVGAIDVYGNATLDWPSFARATARQSGRVSPEVGRGSAQRAAVEGSTQARQGQARRQADLASLWYSPLQRALEGITTKQASPQQWLNTITALQSKGVKSDEIEFSGVKEWLATREGKISRNELLSFLRDNGTRLTETVLGANTEALMKMRKDYIFNVFEREQQDREARGEISEQELDSSLRDFNRALEKAKDRREIVQVLSDEGGYTFSTADEIYRDSDEHVEGSTESPQYAQYTLPGGADYRELLITIPAEAPSIEKRYVDTMLPHGEEVSDPKQVFIYHGTTLPDGDSLILYRVTETPQRAYIIKRKDGTYTVPTADVDADFRDLDAARAHLAKFLVHETPGLMQQVAYADAENAINKWIDHELMRGAMDQQQADHYRQDPFALMREVPTEVLGFDPRRDEPRLMHFQRKLRFEGKTQQAFKSRHWDQPNIVVHVRFDTRTDADGKKVLFVQEIQSDWAQTARREGFMPTPAEIAAQRRLAEENDARRIAEARRELDKVRAELRAMPGDSREMSADDFNRKVHLLNDEQLLLRNLNEVANNPTNVLIRGVPRAPFVQKTEAWTGLALKRIIKYAADNGFDRVAWTTGDQQNARYKLSNQVQAIAYRKDSDDNYWLRALPKDSYGRGAWINLATAVEPTKIDDYVGKELADKIRAGEGQGRDGELTILSGLDLEVGGKGMRSFYDKMVPNTANDILKKLGGGRVEVLDLAPQVLAPSNEELIRRDQWIPANTPQTGGKVLGKQLGFDITPQMRELAMQGMPLFSRRQPRLGMGEQLASVRAALDDAASKELVDALIRQGILRLEPSWENRRELARDPAVRALMSEHDERGPGASIFIDRISARDAPALLAHEVGWHYGAPRMLGQDGYQKILDGIRRAKMKGDAETLAAWARVMDDYTDPDTGKLLLEEGSDNWIAEVGAVMVEKGVNRGWIREMLDAIRSWLARTFGVDVDKVDGNLLRGLATSALRRAGSGMLPRTSMFAADRAGSASRSMSLEADRISPRAPTAVKRTEDPLTQELQPDMRTMMRNREVFLHNLKLLTDSPDIRVDPKAAPEAQAAQIIEHFQRNLEWLYDHYKDFADRSKLWYVGGNKIAHQFANRFGIEPRQAAGVMAALSPQKDWFQNVSLAERLMSAVYEHPDTQWSPAMDNVLATRDWGKGLSGSDRDRIRGKTLRQVWGSGTAQELLSAAHWIRAWDEATNPQMGRVISPEGNFMLDWDSGLTGKPIALRAQGFGAMAKSLRILADGSRESISAVIGANHKVRSFYNNLIAPYSTSGDVTIDTHAVAAAHLLPLGSSDDLVAQTFGGGNVGKPASKSSDLTGLMGNYAFYAEAYRRAAAAKGVLPREMQSVTWEAVRGLFRPEQKVALKGSVAKIWERYGKGEIDENQARAETLKVAGGVAPPKWAGSAAGSTEATRASSYAEELPQAGAPGGGAAPDSVGTDGRGAGGTEDLAPRGPGSPAFERWFGDSKVVDADGNPMPVYHGTDAEFDAFDTTDFGSWFAERPATADKYTDRGARSEGDRQVSGPMVHQVYLRIEKPFEIPSDIDLSDDTFTVAEALQELNAQNGTNITPADIGFPGDYRGNHFESLVMPEMIDVLKRLGFDGIHAYEQGEPTWNAFSPGQIKSTFNRGTYDLNEPDTLAAKGPRSRAMPQPPVNSSQLDAETNAQLLQRKFFDRFNRVRQLQRERRPGIVDDKNIVQADTLYYGRAQYEGEELERKFIEPLGEALKEAKKIGLTVRDADDYLMAMHAPERNRVIAQRNPNMPDGGSGLTNRQAAQILAKYDQKKTAALDKIAQIVYRMNEDRLLRQETSGLISPQFAAAMRAQFKNYVPLKTLEEEGAMLGLGRGYELRNSGIEMAFGRQSKAGSPIAASMMDAARAVVMSEKAKVDRVVWNLANDPDVIDVMTPVDDANAAQHFSRQRMNPTTGQIETVSDSNWRSREDVVKLRVDGEEKYVWVRDDILRDQLRKVAMLSDPGPVLRSLGRVTSTIGRLLTEFNPAFTLPNAVRDAIGGVIKSNGIERVSPMRVLAGIPAAWKAIVDFKRDANTPGARMYREFQEDGAKTGAYGITDVGDTMHRLERLGAELGYAGRERGISTKLMHGLNDLAKFIGHANEVVEYATRLSLYAEARRAKYTRKQAAVWAKELTVNFNRSGEYGRTMNSIFVFANAALQGLYGAIMFGKSNKVKAALLGLVVLGAITQAFNEAYGGDDDDTGEKNVNTLSDHTLDNNATVLVPGSASGIKIPLPPEFSFLYAMGRRAYRAMTQGNYAKEAAGIIGAFLGSTLPLRAPDASSTPLSVMKALTPTAVSPFMDIAVNEDFRGAPIVPHQRDKDAPQPWPVLARSQTSDVSKAIADFVNTATGGDRIEPGAAQKAFGPFASPEAMDHIVGFYTGGLGQFALQSKNIAKAAMGDEKAAEINRIPIANRFVFTQPQGYVGRRYRELASDFQYAIARQRDGSTERVAPEVFAALPAYRGAERQLAPLFKQLRSAAEEGDKTREEELRSQIRAVQSTVLKAYNEARTQ